MNGEDAPDITTPCPKSAARRWFELMERFCAAADFDAAERIFARDAVSFGANMDIVCGRKRLRKSEWEGVWNNISGFKIDIDNIHAGGNGRSAWGVATWTSIGFDYEHKPFYRPGRASVVLERRGGRWLAVHAHFSLYPGAPHRTFGRRRA